MSIIKTSILLSYLALALVASACSDDDDNTTTNNNASSTCEAGAIKCDNSLAGIQGSIAYFVCKDGAWSEDSTRCDDGLICSESDQKCIKNPNPDCVEGEVLCVDDTTYQVCDASRGFWSTGIGTCESGTKCDKDQKKCVADNSEDEESCEAGAIKCDNSLAGIQGSIAYFVCKDGAWSEDSTRCDDGLICSESDQKCITNPTPDCVEGEVLCVDDTTYQVCDASRGLWTTGIGTCESGTKCDKDQKKCVAAAE